MAMAEVLQLVAFRSDLASRLEARTEEMVNAISSALFAELGSYERLGHIGEVEKFRAGIRRTIEAFAAFVAEGTPFTDADLASFHLTGAERARQGHPYRAVVDSVDITMEAIWRFVRECVEDPALPALAAQAVADVARDAPAFVAEMRESLIKGYTGEQEHGELGRAQAIADIVGVLVAGHWQERRDILRPARAVGAELYEPLTLIAVVPVTRRALIDLDDTARAVAAALPRAVAGRTRNTAVPHAVVFVPRVDPPVVRNALLGLSDIRNVLLLVDEDTHEFVDIPAAVARLEEDIPSALSVAPDSLVVTTAQTAVMRLLRHVPIETRVDFVRGVLGPLLELPGNKANDALATLAAYFRGRAGSRLDETAANLQLHRNSFRYRLDRIQTLLGVSFRNAADRFRVEVAVTLHELARRELVLADDPPFENDGPNSAQGVDTASARGGEVAW